MINCTRQWFAAVFPVPKGFQRHASRIRCRVALYTVRVRTLQGSFPPSRCGSGCLEGRRPLGAVGTLAARSVDNISHQSGAINQEGQASKVHPHRLISSLPLPTGPLRASAKRTPGCQGKRGLLMEAAMRKHAVSLCRRIEASIAQAARPGWPDRLDLLPEKARQKLRSHLADTPPLAARLPLIFQSARMGMGPRLASVCITRHIAIDRVQYVFFQHLFGFFNNVH